MMVIAKCVTTQKSWIESKYLMRKEDKILVRSRRINLEGNTHAQEINVSQLPV
jgi:hypothetical protein